MSSNLKDRELPAPAFYSVPDVVRITGLSRSTVYREVKAGRLPSLRFVSKGRRAFVAEEITAWVAARKEGK